MTIAITMVVNSWYMGWTPVIVVTLRFSTQGLKICHLLCTPKVLQNLRWKGLLPGQPWSPGPSFPLLIQFSMALAGWKVTILGFFSEFNFAKMWVVGDGPIFLWLTKKCCENPIPCRLYPFIMYDTYSIALRPQELHTCRSCMIM